MHKWELFIISRYGGRIGKQSVWNDYFFSTTSMKQRAYPGFPSATCRTDSYNTVENQTLELNLMQGEGAGWPLWSDSDIFQQWGQNLVLLPSGWREPSDTRPRYDAFNWTGFLSSCAVWLLVLQWQKKCSKCDDSFAQ